MPKTPPKKEILPSQLTSGEFDGVANQNLRVVSMLGGAGLTSIDLQFFDSLHRNGAAVFVHGSLVENRIRPHSDVDFTVVGEDSAIPVSLRDTLFPGLDAAETKYKIDYTSTSIYSQGGRKLSLHISRLHFRDSHPDIEKPYATEYRPGMHAKTGPRNYLLAGTNQSGTPRVINFTSNSERIGESGDTVTNLPQTGVIHIDGRLVYAGDSLVPGIHADSIINLDPNGEVKSIRANADEELMILGLEFDKIQSDVPLYSDPTSQQRFVDNPNARSMEALGEFSSTEPAVITGRLFGALATHWTTFKPNKLR